MSTASPITGGKRYTPRFAQGLLDTCVRMPRSGSRGGDNPPISLSSHSPQLCAHECVHRPAGSARSYARRPASSPDLLVKFVVTARRAVSTLRCSGDSLCPPNAGPKRDDVARVDLLPHYCHVHCTDGGRRCARESAGGKLPAVIGPHHSAWAGMERGPMASVVFEARSMPAKQLACFSREQPGGCPDSTVLTARLRLRTDARQRPGVA